MTGQPAKRSQAVVMGDTAVEVVLSIRAEHDEGMLWVALGRAGWWRSWRVVRLAAIGGRLA